MSTQVEFSDVAQACILSLVTLYKVQADVLCVTCVGDMSWCYQISPNEVS